MSSSPSPSPLAGAAVAGVAAGHSHDKARGELQVNVENANAEAAAAIVDVDDADTRKVPTVEYGLWTPSRFGTLIRCRQWRVLGSGFRFILDGRLMLGSSTSFFWISLVIYLISIVVVFIYFE